ncbi:MAG: histidine kinase [Bullifex sp.]|nr:histidine kinase [Bullifex sp.]
MSKGNRNLIRIFLRHSFPMLITIIFLGIISSGITLYSIRKSTTEMANSTLSQTITYYDSVMDELDAINTMLLRNPDILTNLKQVHDISQMDYQLFRETQLVKSFFTSIANTRPTVSAIFLYIDNQTGYILYSGSGYEKLNEVGEEEWVSEYMKKPTSYTLESERHDNNIIRLSRPILDRNDEKIGVIILDVRISEMTNFFEKNSGRAAPFVEVFNEKGEPLFSYSQLPFNEKNPFSVSMSSPKYGWQYSLSFSRKELFAPSHSIIYLTFLAIVFATALGLLLTYRTNMEERRFINNLIEALNRSGAELEQPKEDENIFVRLDDLILKHFVEQDYLKLRSEALEYRALQLQINPHFLFNTLNNLYWKAVRTSGGENDLSQMTKLLSNLMKQSLRFDNHSGIPLREELESVETYIELQHFRFKDSFVFSTSIPEEFMDMPVPWMIFQPVLENAFNYGFMEGKTLHIEIRAVRDGDFLVFSIIDDGNPFPENVLDGVRNKNAKALESSSSLGLLNTRDRIDLFYNHQGEMNIFNKDGMACVVFRFPLSGGGSSAQ